MIVGRAVGEAGVAGDEVPEAVGELMKDERKASKLFPLPLDEPFADDLVLDEPEESPDTEREPLAWVLLSVAVVAGGAGAEPSLASANFSK